MRHSLLRKLLMVSATAMLTLSLGTTSMAQTKPKPKPPAGTTKPGPARPGGSNTVELDDSADRVLRQDRGQAAPRRRSRPTTGLPPAVAGRR